MFQSLPEFHSSIKLFKDVYDLQSIRFHFKSYNSKHVPQNNIISSGDFCNAGSENIMLKFLIIYYLDTNFCPISGYLLVCNIYFNPASNI